MNEPPRLSIAFGVGSLFQRSSGPFATTLQTAQDLRARGHQVSVLGTRRRGDIGPPSGFEGLQTVAFPTIGPRSLHYAPRARSWLRRGTWFPDVISLEGVWLHLFATVARWAKQRRIPYMITPHGNFNPVALGISSWKKSLARRWFADELLAGATCFHAITEQEFRWIREYGLRQPVCVIPNGVELAPLRSRAAHANDRVALYVGRLHSIKGLDLLLRAWNSVVAVHPGWKLAIAGGDDGAERSLREMQSSLSLQETVQFLGPVHSDEKTELLTNCEFMVLPSRSEGLAMAPLEAMSHGRPVLLTSNCNFPKAASQGAGIEVECSEAGLRDGLHLMMSMSPDDLERMGARGRALIETEFNSTLTCSRLEQVYGWMAGKNPPPEILRFD